MSMSPYRCDTIPAIHATEGGITLEVETFDQVLVTAKDSNTNTVKSDTIVTQTGLDDGLSKTKESIEDEIDQLFKANNLALEEEMDQMIFNAVDDIKTNVNKNTQTLQEHSTSIQKESERVDQLITSIDALKEEVGVLAETLEKVSNVINLSIACPPYPNLNNGKVLGHALYPGAVRFLSCNTGYMLSAYQDTVVCNSTGQWSDNGTTTCIIATTPSPTVQPTIDSETVTCCMLTEDAFVRAYADGVRLKYNGQPTNRYDAGFIQFESSTKVLGIHSSEVPCGDSCGGGIILMCGTPSGKGPWNLVSPVRDFVLDNPEMNKTIHDQWKVRVFHQELSGYDSSLWESMTNSWSKPGYDVASNDFKHPIWPTTRVQSSTFSRFDEKQQCQFYVTNGGSHFDITGNKMGRVRGGTPKYPIKNYRPVDGKTYRTDYFWRIDVTSE